MARVRKLVLVCLVVLFLLVALVFSLNNRTTVSIDFLTWQTPEMSLALWLIGSLFIGAILGLGVGLMASIRGGMNRKHLQKQLDQCRKALERNRSENAKGL